MRSALRSIAAVVCGFIVASIVMMIVEAINGGVLYPELAKAADAYVPWTPLRRVNTSSLRSDGPTIAPLRPC